MEQKSEKHSQLTSSCLQRDKAEASALVPFVIVDAVAAAAIAADVSS